MEKIKKNMTFSKEFLDRSEALERGLKKVSEKLIEETKKNNSYLVVSDDNGNIKKIPAKDL